MSKAAKMAAAWWTERLEQGSPEAKEIFRKRIEEIVDLVLLHESEVVIKTDYDPDEHLQDALDKAGIKSESIMAVTCRGVLPIKHLLCVTYEELEPKEGYGNWTDKIPVPKQNFVQRLIDYLRK